MRILSIPFPCEAASPPLPLPPGQNGIAVDTHPYLDNLRLNEIEFARRHLYLYSRPRVLGLVLGNACNLRCLHCYQPHNADHLLRPAAIGRELRREFAGLYPFLSTLRINGGEVFALDGFSDLLYDASALADRPIVSVSTNATLIDEAWAERIVRTPFLSLTVSIDAANPATFARLRRGAGLDHVLENVRRIQRWKLQLASDLPLIDSFFVVMRSNYRELPQYFDLLRRESIEEVALQTLEITNHNSDQARAEVLSDPAEVRDLHAILRDALAPGGFRRVSVSGLRCLFDAHGLDSAFLDEGLYPDTRGGAPAVCPNPWTTLFVAENGDAHLCFLSTPLDNLYRTPLTEIWNSPAALAKRANIAAGRYLKSGCSPDYCGWREGQASPPSPLQLLDEFQALKQAMAESPSPPAADGDLAAVRRALAARDRRIAELEALHAHLCETNAQFHARGRAYIDELEHRLAQAQHDLVAYRDPLLVRIAARLASLLRLKRS